ncbi:MAG: hypothetical protein DMF78_04435 [Acidobacteria bacterium]|nr:MAG: hypothetical protein DMF78_04435 [Acidobacteriota bacterium]
MWAWFHCWLRSHHNPARHPLGGFRCLDCGAMGIDLRDMGYKELGGLTRNRRFFSRDDTSWTARSSVTPRSGWISR